VGQIGVLLDVRLGLDERFLDGSRRASLIANQKSRVNWPQLALPSEGDHVAGKADHRPSRHCKKGGISTLR